MNLFQKLELQCSYTEFMHFFLACEEASYTKPVIYLLAQRFQKLRLDDNLLEAWRPCSVRTQKTLDM